MKKGSEFSVDYRQIVEALLYKAGIHLDDKDVEELATAYPMIIEWEKIVEGMVKETTDPALIFSAGEETCL